LSVVGVNRGKSGKKYGDVLGALIVNFRGTGVCVGSGYSDQQRVEFLDNPPKVIEIEYKSITKDGSLFHPSFVRIRADK
jgi:ATP-dependent DNA ligase